MSEELYQKLNEADPDRAEALVNKYNVIMAEMDNTVLPADDVQIARARLDALRNTIEDSGVDKRTELMTAFDEDLTDVAISLGIEFNPTVDLPKVTAPGFAERPQENEMEALFRSLSAKDAKGIFGALAEEMAGMEISAEKQSRIDQLSILVTALEGLKNEINNSAGIGEDIVQILEFDEETKNRAGAVDSLIFNVKNLGLKAILRDGLSVDEVFEKYKNLFGDKAKKLLSSYGEAEAFFEENGRFKDVKTEGEKAQYYLTLVKFLEDQHDYATAQSIMEEILLKDVFENSRKTIEADKGLSKQMEREAIAYIGKKFDVAQMEEVEKGLRKQMEERGMKPAEIDNYNFTPEIISYRDNVLVPAQLKHMQNQYAAQHLIFYENQEYSGSDGHRHFTIQDPKLAAAWHEYDTMLNPKNKTFELAEENWDLILEELMITAPMIIMSGGVAGIAMKGLSWGARLAINGTRLATWGERLAAGGRLARGALGMAKLGGRGVSLVSEAFLFEMNFMGLQGDWVLDQPEWVTKTLWTAASLGAFKFAGKIGKVHADNFNKLLTEVAPKLGNSNFVKIVSSLLVKGNYEVAAMLVVNGVHHLSEGEFQEFWDNFGYQLFRAYISVGALHVAGGLARTAGGKIFRPGNGAAKKAPSAAETSVGKEKGEKTATEKPKDEVSDERGRTGNGILARLRDVISSGESTEAGFKNINEIGDAAKLLQDAGFKIVTTPEGGLIATKGNQTVSVKPKGKLVENFKGIREGLSKLAQTIGRNAEGGKDLVKGIKNEIGDLYARLREIGLSKSQALGVLAAILTPGAAEASAWGAVQGTFTGILIGVVVGGLGAGAFGAWKAFDVGTRLKGKKIDSATKAVNAARLGSSGINALSSSADITTFRDLLVAQDAALTELSKGLGKADQVLVTTMIMSIRKLVVDLDAGTVNEKVIKDTMKDLGENSLKLTKYDPTDPKKRSVFITIVLVLAGLGGLGGLVFGGDSDDKKKEGGAPAPKAPQAPGRIETKPAPVPKNDDTQTEESDDGASDERRGGGGAATPKSEPETDAVDPNAPQIRVIKRKRK